MEMREKCLRWFRCQRYWSTNGVSIAVVQSVTDGIDWCAYIGATTDKDARSEHETVEWTLRHGTKLREEDARWFCPSIALPYRA